MSLTLAKANPKDARVLTEISMESFNTDVHVGAPGPGPGGPPGYDSVDWQTKMINGCDCDYLKIMYDGKIIGGAIVFPSQKAGEYFLGRIFIDSKYHRQGLGEKASRMLENLFPDATRWLLDTPSWNQRTRNFYTKLGYTLIKDGDMLVFEKVQ